ncbi:hypothetical protein HHI36_000225 [Cryptolaemus montrouzieri]|uniref:Uncharacterized protein n=1 Tax=Cryptolaemus montrouzieri TaxID=559131 RepID=A0ABD2P411_9CUCU
MEIIKFLQYTFYVFYWSYLIGNSSEGHKIDSVTNMRYEIQERNVIIEWDLPGNLQLKDEHYQVEYDYRKKFGFCPREGRTQSGDTIERKKIIYYLNYFSIYNIYVRIHNISTGGNEEEYGNWKLLTFETPPGELSHSELSGVDLKLVNYTRDTISFQIENLKCEQIHGSLIFKVVVEKKNPWCTNSVALSREIQLDKVNNLVFKFPLFMDPSEKYIYKGQLCRSSKCIPLSEGLLQINSTDNSTPTFPIMFNVTWNEENMMEIYWTYNHIEKMTGLKIFVQTVQSIPQYKEDNFNCKRIDDHCSACVIQNPLRINNTFQFPEKFLPSTRLIIEIFADDSHNVVRSRKLVTSSYPPFPALKDTMIRIEKLKNDTLDVTLNVAGINSKFDVTWCKLFILINDSTSEDTEVTRKIENFST